MSQMNRMTDTGMGIGGTGISGTGIATLVGGAMAGALLMYLLDPDRGGARRAQSADAVRGVWRGAGERIGAVVDDARDTARGAASGVAASVAHAIRPDGSALSRLGQAASDALDSTVERAKDVIARAGGTLDEGRDRAGRTLAHAAGSVQDASADARDSAGRFARTVGSALQPAPGAWGGWQRNSVLAAGALLAVTGLMRRSPLGWALGLGGAALLVRGVANQPLRGLLSGRALASPLQRTIDFEKSIHIDAAPETVYDLWTNYENFPRFMSHVIEVRDLGRRRSHWVVRGPGGSEFEWNSVLTEQSRPRRLAWRSEPGAEIPQSGSIEFVARGGGTDVVVRMSYTPPAGALGHGLATLLGSDPKSRMDEDLARMKTYIERGALPRGAAEGRHASRFLH